jgi:cell division protein FtsB
MTVVSCSSGSSFEKDGRKMGKLICKQQQLERKLMNGDQSVKAELEKVRAERDKLKDELSEKYKDQQGNDEMRKRAREILDEEMANCK